MIPRQSFPVYPAVGGSAVVLGVLAPGANAGAWNRSVVLAAPCVACVKRLPFVALAALVIAVGTTTALISHPFFTGRLV